MISHNSQFHCKIKMIIWITTTTITWIMVFIPIIYNGKIQTKIILIIITIRIIIKICNNYLLSLINITNTIYMGIRILILNKPNNNLHKINIIIIRTLSLYLHSSNNRHPNKWSILNTILNLNSKKEKDHLKDNMIQSLNNKSKFKKYQNNTINLNQENNNNPTNSQHIIQIIIKHLILLMNCLLLLKKIKPIQFHLLKMMMMLTYKNVQKGVEEDSKKML